MALLWDFSTFTQCLLLCELPAEPPKAPCPSVRWVGASTGGQNFPSWLLAKEPSLACAVRGRSPHIIIIIIIFIIIIIRHLAGSCGPEEALDKGCPPPNDARETSAANSCSC